MNAYDPKARRGRREVEPDEPAPVDALLGAAATGPTDTATEAEAAAGSVPGAAAAAPVPGAPLAPAPPNRPAASSSDSSPPSTPAAPAPPAAGPGPAPKPPTEVPNRDRWSPDPSTGTSPGSPPDPDRSLAFTVGAAVVAALTVLVALVALVVAGRRRRR